MNDGPQAGSRMASEATDDPVDVLAARALTLVARKTSRTPRALVPLFLEQMHEAAVNGDRADFATLLRQMELAGIRREDIADHYVPAVARRMGDLWCEDRMGFAAVTIGVSRLQGFLRDLGPEWRADKAADPDAPALLVIVSVDVYHTLGATVLAGQLRRRGLSVRLLIGARPDDVAPAMRQSCVDAVLISSSYGESLETLRRLVDAVRAAQTRTMPVVIGGTITDTGRAVGADIKALTGADHVTSDLQEALDVCGMTSTRRSNALRRQGT
jgi:methylmalonyl-CoA mutase cobalamin-binding subunit